MYTTARLCRVSEGGSLAEPAAVEKWSLRQLNTLAEYIEKVARRDAAATSQPSKKSVHREVEEKGADKKLKKQLQSAATGCRCLRQRHRERP